MPDTNESSLGMQVNFSFFNRLAFRIKFRLYFSTFSFVFFISCCWWCLCRRRSRRYRYYVSVFTTIYIHLSLHTIQHHGSISISDRFVILSIAMATAAAAVISIFGQCFNASTQQNWMQWLKQWVIMSIQQQQRQLDAVYLISIGSFFFFRFFIIFFFSWALVIARCQWVQN